MKVPITVIAIVANITTNTTFTKISVLGIPIVKGKLANTAAPKPLGNITIIMFLCFSILVFHVTVGAATSLLDNNNHAIPIPTIVNCMSPIVAIMPI